MILQFFVKIVDDENRRLGPEENGEICIRPKKYDIKVNEHTIMNDGRR